MLRTCIFCRKEERNDEREVKSVKKAPKRKESKDLIACMYEDFKKKQQEIQDTKNNLLESSPEGLFFEHCAKRMKSLQDNVKGALQIQIQQLFFNAENPDAPPLPIMPLPLQQRRPLQELQVVGSQVYSSAMEVLRNDE